MRYTGKHKVGEVTTHRGHTVRVTAVWNCEGMNGLTIEPTGNYGFPVDLFEKDLKENANEDNM